MATKIDLENVPSRNGRDQGRIDQMVVGIGFAQVAAILAVLRLFSSGHPIGRAKPHRSLWSKRCCSASPYRLQAIRRRSENTRPGVYREAERAGDQLCAVSMAPSWRAAAGCPRPESSAPFEESRRRTLKVVARSAAPAHWAGCASTRMCGTPAPRLFAARTKCGSG